MINFALERQAKSIDELLHRLVEERDGKKLDTTSVNPSSSTCVVCFTQTNPHTSGASAGGTSMPNSSARPVDHFHGRTTIEGSAPTLPRPHAPPGVMAEHTYTIAATTRLRISP
jgi:hypothetical protein